MSKNLSTKIIPVFIPHIGCPNDCVFCNQRRITGRQSPVDVQTIREDIRQALETVGPDRDIEIAFFGGSFTAIEREFQEECLRIACSFMDQDRRIQDIRISTRPDAVDQSILEFLREYRVSIIELGVQSLDDEVLRCSNRGHDAACVYTAAELIKAAGFQLGIQMMIGLPGDNAKKCLDTCRKIVGIKPDFARIYPVLVISQTVLEDRMREQSYTPLTIEEAVDIAKKVQLILVSNDIKVIRLGLQASDNINIGQDVMGGPFHPAMGELVLSAMYRDFLTHYIITNDIKKNIEIFSHKSKLSALIGNGKSNRLFFENTYGMKMICKEKPTLAKDEIEIQGNLITGKCIRKTLYDLYFEGGQSLVP